MRGPTFTLLHLMRVFGVTYFPQPLKLLTAGAYVLGRVIIGPLDKILGAHKDAHAAIRRVRGSDRRCAPACVTI